MKRLGAVFTIALVLGAIILAPRVGAQAQDLRQERPTEIDKSQTISSRARINSSTISLQRPPPMAPACRLPQTRHDRPRRFYNKRHFSERRFIPRIPHGDRSREQSYGHHPAERVNLRKFV